MEQNKCLCGCGKPPWSRGLCHSAYQYASRLIRSGATTWEILVEQGKALESRQSEGRKNQKRREFFLGESK